MSREDDSAWALGWLIDHPGLAECSSARVMIDGITQGLRGRGFSTTSADCLCCIPAGG